MITRALWIGYDTPRDKLTGIDLRNLGIDVSIQTSYTEGARQAGDYDFVILSCLNPRHSYDPREKVLEQTRDLVMPRILIKNGKKDKIKVNEATQGRVISIDPSEIPDGDLASIIRDAYQSERDRALVPN